MPIQSIQSIRPIRQSLRALADIVFPRHCAHCGDLTEDSPYLFLCTACARQIHLCVPPACRTCGHPFFGQLAGPRSCPHCEDLDPDFEEGRTLFLARGPARTLLHELKYNYGPHVLQDIRVMATQNQHFLEHLQNAILVPVPLHPTKERERGYNQSEKIARLLANTIGAGTRVERLLLRPRPTQTQTFLNRSERQQNVKNAFALQPDAVVNSRSIHILIDDVFTTGATLNACAATLRKAGAARIKVGTLGHG